MDFASGQWREEWFFSSFLNFSWIFKFTVSIYCRIRKKHLLCGCKSWMYICVYLYKMSMYIVHIYSVCSRGLSGTSPSGQRKYPVSHSYTWPWVVAHVRIVGTMDEPKRAFPHLCSLKYPISVPPSPTKRNIFVVAVISLCWKQFSLVRLDPTAWPKKGALFRPLPLWFCGLQRWGGGCHHTVWEEDLTFCVELLILLD